MLKSEFREPFPKVNPKNFHMKMSGFIVLFYSAKLIWSFVGKVAHTTHLVINEAESLLLQKEKEF